MLDSGQRMPTTRDSRKPDILRHIVVLCERHIHEHDILLCTPETSIQAASHINVTHSTDRLFIFDAG
jgi:hypothetical protein